LLPRRSGPDRQGVDAVAEQVRQRRIDRPLALHPAHPFEPIGFDLDREMALAAAVVAGMAAVPGAVVGHGETGGSEGGLKALFNLERHGTGERLGHVAYIGSFGAKVT
jgi:hypothetical protein